ncbi:MAG: SDR family oxidoreductase [Chitinophagales bacterium]
MKITVIGANGRTGKLIVEEALAKGWQVVAYLRNKQKLPIVHANLTFVEGDAYNASQIGKAIEGADAVVSALGQSDISGKVDLMSDGMKNIIPAMLQHHVKRVIAIGGMGALQANANMLIKDLPDFPAEYKNVSEGHYKVFNLLQPTSLDWTFVCCPYIPDGAKTNNYQVRKDYLPNGKQQIFTGDIAAFVVKELEQNQFLQTRVGISN